MWLRVVLGLLVVVLTTAVVFGGDPLAVCGRQVVVPVMAVMYVLGLLVVVLDVAEVPAMFAVIIQGASASRSS
ncbi:alanine:cation symporter family protein [Kocuria rhizophila]|nr:alanine:cation symporter family protein [Kocuria rhizophila]